MLLYIILLKIYKMYKNIVTQLLESITQNRLK